jgi:hypothetical protein
MTERLPLRTRRILTADGSVRSALHVMCPERLRSVDVDACRRCSKLQCITKDQLECSPAVPERVHFDLSVGSLASPLVCCVRGDVVAASVAPWVSAEPFAVPVVDRADQFIGFFSPSHAMLPGFPPGLAMAMTVGELAFGAVLVAHEAEPWPRVLRRMAHRQSRVFAIVDDSGVPSGVLTDIDALHRLRLPRV